MLPSSGVELHHSKLVVFDNDGTLYPTGPEVGRVVLTAHKDYVKLHGLDIPTPDFSLVEALIGADAKTFYAAMMPDQPPGVQQEFEDFCLDYERKVIEDHPELYDGAVELLDALKAAGRKMALVTNGGPTYVKYIWDTCGYERWFDGCYPFEAPEYSTKGERLALAVKEIGGPAVMVGDRYSDKEAAQFAGTKFIGCAYGYGSPDELIGADAVVKDVTGLYNLLLAPEER